MSNMPDDLIPLPTRPYDERPSALPLDVEECRTAIWMEQGNITKAAQLLKVPPSRLRKFVSGSPRLQREVDEAAEQIIDMAEEVVRDALADPERADPMARFVLGSSRARKRGWGNGAQTNVNVNNVSNVTFQWADGSGMTHGDAKDAGQVIEGDYKTIEAAE